MWKIQSRIFLGGETICITVVLHFTTCCKRALGIKLFKSPCYRRRDFCSLSLLRLSFCQPVKLQPLARWLKYIGSGFCRKNPISWLSRDNKPGGRWRGRAPHLWDGHYTRGGMLKHKCCWCWFVNYLHSPVLYQPVRSWRLMGTTDRPVGVRTYSFSSAISRGCLTEEQNLDVKAGIQPTLQVLTHTHTHTPHTQCCFLWFTGTS